MLRSVADKIRSCFDTLYAYRVGGDEFVIFVCDKPETETRQRILEMEDILKGKGYFVSAGYAWASVPIKDVEMLIKDAEKRCTCKSRSTIATLSTTGGRGRPSRRSVIL